MKKILALSAVLALSMATTFAADTTYSSRLKKAIKDDVKNQKEVIRTYHKQVMNDAGEYVDVIERDVDDYKESAQEALQKEIQAKRQAALQAQKARKDQRTNEINYKVKKLNEELEEIENNKNMTLTEKAVRSRAIKKQIEIYNLHKSKL